jgi:cyclopropane-fatty-acyl-phospholipid synthase
VNPARALVLALLGRIPEGELTVWEHGKRFVLGRGDPKAAVWINSPRAWMLLLRGSRGMADGYIDGIWEADELSSVVRVAARNVQVLDRWRRRMTVARVPLQALRGLRRANSRARSRHDIAAHYDLGNDFFALMLDETMMYSCAYFPHAEATLAEASRAKLERVCEKLDLSAGDHVLEIGTGWGGFAIYAASTRGCRVTTTTISRAQYEHARRRVERAGLGHLVTVLCEDYRDLRGRYDKLVSIEMIEAVGWRNLGGFFARCSQLLRPSGVMLLEAIVIDDRAYEVEKASRSFIRSYIFPGGSLPSVEAIARCVATHTDLRIAGLEELTPHYVETLRRWGRNFDASAERLTRLGYGERFQRLWRFYLAYSEAGFAENRIGVVQTLLAKPRWRVPTGLPHTFAGEDQQGEAVRGRLYRDRSSEPAIPGAISAAAARTPRRPQALRRQEPAPEVEKPPASGGFH